MAPGISEPVARAGHIVVSRGNKVLVWGGYTDQQYNDEYLVPSTLWVYCRLSRQWKKHYTDGDLPEAASGACGVLVDNFLYVLCGHTPHGNTNATHRLDLRTYVWSHVDVGPENKKPSPRDKFTAWHHDNSIFIFGGFGLPLTQNLCEHGKYVWDESTTSPRRGWNNQLLSLCLKTDTWTNHRSKGTVPSPRAAHAAAVIGSRVFLFGGRHMRQRLNDLYILDMDTLVWTSVQPVGDVPLPRTWHTFTPTSFSPTTSILLYGGFSQDDRVLADSWLFNTESLSWQQMPTDGQYPRLWHGACICDNETIVVFGGCKENILDYTLQATHSDKLLFFRCSPFSLLDLCLETAYKHQDVLSSYWSSLPHDLRDLLNIRKSGSTQDEIDGVTGGLSCVVS